MCIRHENKYVQCGHRGVKFERCELYKDNLKSCRRTEKHTEIISDRCRKCGGGPQQEPVINYVKEEDIPSWSREAAANPDPPSRLDSSVELMRQGSQKAIDGMKRFIADSIRSSRSSGGSSNFVDAVSETETGENATSHPSMNEPSAESKTANASSFRARPWQRLTEGSSGFIHSSSNTPGSAHITRPSAGRDIETASIVTTWTKIMLKAGGLPDTGRAEDKQVDEFLYQKRIEVPQVNEVVHQRRFKELLRADEHLARVRDGRGYINFNVV
jgi:hypothetical protein